MRNTTRAQQVAQIVREARESHGMTQTELARECGVHQQTIGNLERATYRTSPELLSKIEKILDIELSASAIAAREAITLVASALEARLNTLDDVASLMLVGDTLRYVASWELRGPAEHGETPQDEASS